jgi:hypothetical protein
MSPVIALRVLSGTSMTITLPTLSTSVRGQIFTFVKTSTNFTVTFNTSGGNYIFPLNNLTGTPTTNSTIFPDNKRTCKLAVGWFSTVTYWIEVGDYSTLEVDTNNSIYARLAIANTFTNTNTFTTVNATTLSSPTIFSTNYNTTSATGTTSFSANTTTGIISIGSGLTTTGTIDLGNTTSNTRIFGILTFYNSLTPPFKFTNIQQLSSNLNIENTTFSGSIYLKTRPSFGASVDSVIITATETTILNNLVSNNLTAPASTIAGINNIFTNLSSGGYGVINIGAQGDDGSSSTMNQINVKSKLN